MDKSTYSVELTREELNLLIEALLTERRRLSDESASFLRAQMDHNALACSVRWGKCKALWEKLFSLKRER